MTEYVFNKFPGMELQNRNQLDAFRATETDLVFTNDIRRSGLYVLEPVVIIECKNYATSVGSADITYFAARLRQKGARVGILVTTTQVSGSVGHSGVHALEQALVDGITILVIDGATLSSISSTDELTRILITQMVNYRTLGTLV